MLAIYVDADACPVKHEVCRVAKRCNLNVTFVSNMRMRIPAQDGVALVVVDGQFDAADNWIAEQAGKDDIVVTADIPLASRCVKRGARVVSPNGRVFSAANIGDVLATRNLLAELRDAGTVRGGPPPFQQRDCSRFLQSLDQTVQDVKRAK